MHNSRYVASSQWWKWDYSHEMALASCYDIQFVTVTYLLAIFEYNNASVEIQEEENGKIDQFGLLLVSLLFCVTIKRP